MRYRRRINEKKEDIIIADDFSIRDIVEEEIRRLGFEADLNHIDVSQVTDMRSLFKYRNYSSTNPWDEYYDPEEIDRGEFVGDISKWDVSNVVDMSNMFEGSYFDGDISKWDVSNVVDMSHMFSESYFNGDISKWDVSAVEDMRYMFYGAKFFEQDISKWDVFSKPNAHYKFWDMFRQCKSLEKKIGKININAEEYFKQGKKNESFRKTIKEGYHDYLKRANQFLR